MSKLLFTTSTAVLYKNATGMCDDDQFVRGGEPLIVVGPARLDVENTFRTLVLTRFGTGWMLPLYLEALE